MGDAALLVRGPLIPTPTDQGQEAIYEALNFGKENGLTFGADKTVALILTRRRLDIWKFKMGEQTLEYKESVKD